MPINFRSKDFIEVTADDEEPCCLMCFNQDICKDGKFCGPKYGWRLYKRYEKREEKRDNDK